MHSTTGNIEDKILSEADTRSLEDVSIKIPVIEETVQVSKKLVETGRILISKTVSEEEQTIHVPLTQEQVEVERVPVNEYVEHAPAIRYEEDTTIIPVVKEVLVVEKRLLLVEEVRITKKKVHTEEDQQVTLRKEAVTVERTAINAENPNS